MAFSAGVRQWPWNKKTTSIGYNTVKDGDNLSSGDRSSMEEGSNDGLLEKGRLHRDNHSDYHVAAWQRPRNLILSHLILFVAYAAVLIAVSKRNTDIRSKGLPISPAVEILEFSNQVFTLEDKVQKKGYVGEPNEELDKAWHDLLNAENIIIETEYIEKMHRENIGVAVPEGTGYLGTLNVYHELHCLKRLHQYMYPDYYFPGLTQRQMELNRLHNEHCIDFLRQASMCHGDVGLLTYEWHDDSLLPVANATSHQCINWDKLDRWTKARTVDMMRPGWLVHPRFGVAYPDGEGNKIGLVDPHDG